MDVHKLTIFFLTVVHMEATSEHVTVRACEPPKNIDALPAFAQEELKTTWKSYKKGEPCEGQLLITDDILAAVDIFAHGYRTSSPNKSLDTSTLYYVPESNRRLGQLQQSSLHVSPKDLYSSDDDQFMSNLGESYTLATDYGDYLDENFQSSSSTTSESPPNSRSSVDVSEHVHEGIYADGGVSFLKSVDPEVRRAFENMMQDPDVPSEGLRQEKIHLLAVSLLNADQLLAYNKYATERRKQARAHHARLSILSNAARKALGVIARAQPDHQYALQSGLIEGTRRGVEEPPARAFAANGRRGPR
ncbi:unnamed protein product [Toxocara canis]|uniref:Uncharacterized protein n=1 Tax=Toxocara canis TaxID=6265 RepID=A0A183UB92_TOXCA|nr:unnamed protein product [Toxocara canis]